MVKFLAQHFYLYFFLRLGLEFRCCDSYSEQHSPTAKDRAESWGHVDLGSLPLLHWNHQVQVPISSSHVLKSTDAENGGAAGFYAEPFWVSLPTPALRHP